MYFLAMKGKNFFSGKNIGAIRHVRTPDQALNQSMDPMTLGRCLIGQLTFGQQIFGQQIYLAHIHFGLL